MGDRYLIDQTASNALLYTYSSSGIIGVILYIIIFFRSFYLSFVNILNSRLDVNKDNYKYLTVSSIIIFFLVRSITETSFVIFGIDFLIFFISFFYLESKMGQKKYLKFK